MPVVWVVEVAAKDVPVFFEYVAQTQSSHLVNIQARVSGFLDKRMYVEGSVVKDGQILFQMDPKPFRVQLNQAKAALAKQKAACETARLDLARVKPLAEQNALSKKDLDNARGRYLSTAASVAQARPRWIRRNSTFLTPPSGPLLTASAVRPCRPTGPISIPRTVF